MFGEAATLEQSQTRLVINALPDAVYFKGSDTLVFRNLATISSIFKGIDELYKEATKEEVEQFLDESFIELSNDYGVEKVSINSYAIENPDFIREAAEVFGSQAIVVSIDVRKNTNDISSRYSRNSKYIYSMINYYS